jgi:predicted Zn-dependent protease
MAKSSLRKALPLMAGALLLTHCSCDFFGTAGALLVSENDELRLGQQFDARLRTNDTVKAEYPVFKPRKEHPEDVEFQNYVVGLGNEIVAALPEEEKLSYPFTFTILDTNIENAFAVPGGYVYIYTGIIHNMKDESELVGVLGHEISHITRHHYRKSMSEDAAFSLLLQALVGNDSSALVQLVAGSFKSLTLLKASRNNEADADYYGTLKAGLVKRNPLGIAKFFGRVKSQGFAFFSTHPDPGDRVGDVTDEVNTSGILKPIADDSAATNYRTRFQLKAAPILQRP